METKRSEDHRDGRQRQPLFQRERQQVGLLDVRHHQAKHDDQENRLGGKQNTVEQIHRMGADADDPPSDQGEQQYAEVSREVLRSPLADADSQQFASAADIGCGQRIHQEHHAETGKPLAAAAQITFGQRSQTGVRLLMLINFDQQQRGIAH
ncbi:hypothetical protein D3C79_458670 [compost metagenome]